MSRDYLLSQLVQTTSNEIQSNGNHAPSLRPFLKTRRNECEVTLCYVHVFSLHRTNDKLNFSLNEIVWGLIITRLYERLPSCKSNLKSHNVAWWKLKWPVTWPYRGCAVILLNYVLVFVHMAENNYTTAMACFLLGVNDPTSFQQAERHANAIHFVTEMKLQKWQWRRFFSAGPEPTA